MPVAARSVQCSSRSAQQSLSCLGRPPQAGGGSLSNPHSACARPASHHELRLLPTSRAGLTRVRHFARLHPPIKVLLAYVAQP